MQLHLWFLFVSLSLLGYCFILTKYCHIAIEKAPLFVVSGWITLLYVLGYMDWLYSGTLIILLIGVAGAVYTPIMLYQDRAVLFNRYLTPGLVLGVILCFFAVWAAYPIVTLWDAYGFWGSFAKLLRFNHGFIQLENIVPHKDYPPGAALFYYPFMRLKFNESSLIQAQQLLLLCPLIVMARHIQWRKWFLVISLAVVGFLGVEIFVKMALRTTLSYWATLYMDFPIGVCLAGILIAYHLSDKKNSDIIFLLPSVFALALLKAKLMFFIVLIAVSIGVDQLVLGCAYYRHHRHEKWLVILHRKRCAILSRTLSVILIIIAGAAAVYSWHSYVFSVTNEITFGLTQLTFSDIINVLTLKKATPEQIICLKRFFLFAKKPLSVWRVWCNSIVLLGIGWISGYYQCSKTKCYSVLSQQAVLFLGSIAYSLGMLILYLFAFSNAEKQYLASFERYMSIYYLAWVLILWNTIFHTLLEKKNKFLHLKFHVIFLLFALFFISKSVIHSYHFKTTRAWQFRRPFDQIAHAVIRRIQPVPNNNLFIVWQNDAGKSITYLRYLLSPMNVQRDGGSLGSPYSQEDRWTHVFSPDDFLKRICSMDYLLLGYTDEQFWKTYGSLFSAQPPILTPLIRYKMCYGREKFSPAMSQTCQVIQQAAYLFKIIHKKDGRIVFKNLAD
jgi:hypothetical protein